MAKRILMPGILLLACTVGFSNQWHDEADRFWNEGQKLKKDLKYREAIQFLRRAVAAEMKNENPRADELIAQFNELGILYGMTGSFESSLHYYQMTLKAAEKYGREDDEVMALINIGRVSTNLGRHREAIDIYGRALERSRKYGFGDKEVRVLNDMAGALRAMNDFEGALARYTEALDAAKKAGGAVLEAAIISNIGTLYFFRGDFETALKEYGRALDIDKSRGDDMALSIGMNNMGSVYTAIGKYGEALNYFEKSLEIDTRLKNGINIASRLNRIGDIYFRVGDGASAIAHFNRSLEINNRINNRINVAVLNASIGRVYESMGRFEESIDYYIKALALNRELEKETYVAERLSDIGLLYEMRGRHGEAADYFARALERGIGTGGKEKTAANLSNLGRVMTALKRYDVALDYFRQSLEIYRETKDSISIADDLKNCGIVHYHRKEWDLAIDSLLRARGSIEGTPRTIYPVRDEVEGEMYRWLVAAYVMSQRHEMAFEANERFCINRMYSPVHTWKPAGPDPAAGYDRLKDRLGASGAAVVYSNISWDDPQVVCIRREGSSGHVLDKAATVKTIYNHFGREIERFMGEKKTDIIFTVGQRSRSDHYYIEFEKIINYYRYLASKKYIGSDEKDALRRIGKALYDLLLGTIGPAIKGKTELIIQPDGVLSTLPFETLIMPDGRFLVEKYIITYVHSHTISAAAAKRKYNAGRKELMLIGGVTHPSKSLPGVLESVRHYELVKQRAVDAIMKGRDTIGLYGFFGIDDIGGPGGDIKEIELLDGAWKNHDILRDEDVTEGGILGASLAGAFSGYRILHVATRSVVVPEAPILSALVLSSEKGVSGGNGLLNIRKIASLKIAADLVTLSNVFLPPARYSKGEGIWSLCGSFMDAGARNVAISIWPVEGAVKMALIKRAYRLALEEKLPYCSAFARAKREFITQKADDSSPGGSPGNYSSPYFWGSFMLYGY